METGQKLNLTLPVWHTGVVPDLHKATVNRQNIENIEDIESRIMNIAYLLLVDLRVPTFNFILRQTGIR